MAIIGQMKGKKKKKKESLKCVIQQKITQPDQFPTIKIYLPFESTHRQ